MSLGFAYYLIIGALYLLVHYLLARPFFPKTPSDNWAETPYASGSGPLFLLLWPIILFLDGVRYCMVQKSRRIVHNAYKAVNVPETLQRLDSIIIPKVDLRQADIHVIAEFLNSVGRQLAKRRVNSASG